MHSKSKSFKQGARATRVTEASYSPGAFGADRSPSFYPFGAEWTWHGGWGPPARGEMVRGEGEPRLAEEKSSDRNDFSAAAADPEGYQVVGPGGILRRSKSPLPNRQRNPPS